MEQIWRCGECHAKVPPDNRDPCPDCGSVTRHITATMTSTVNFSDSATADAQLGTTGRRTRVLDTEKGTVYEEVAAFPDWLADEGKDLTWPEVLERSRFAAGIAEEVRAARTKGLTGTLWRGRRFASADAPDGVEDLGPPPDGKATVGRFNEDGHPVLYCTRAKQVVPAEVPDDHEKPDLWVQRFDVAAEDLGVLELNTEFAEEHPLLHNLLFLAERQAKDKGLYRLTHFVRELCRRADIEAVEYPSVAAGHADDPEALNIVVFGGGIPVVMTCAAGEPTPMET